jgi:hypothetical protein
MMCVDNTTDIPSDRCHLLGYYEKAQEVVTLQAMLQYCVEHPDHHVTYLHDKGSFHAKVGVDRNRRIGTKGALACLLENDYHSATGSNQPQCNVCATDFSTHPHAHVPGNMFAAQCQYISQLVRRNICHFIHRHGISSRPKVDTSFCPSAAGVLLEGANTSGINSVVAANDGAAESDNVGYGFGRYAMERWVASHPMFNIICTVFHNATKKAFDTGWEHWEPKSISHVKRGKRISTDERRNLLFLIHEYAYSYGILNPRSNPDYFCQTYFSKYRAVCAGGVSKVFREAWAAERKNETTAGMGEYEYSIHSIETSLWAQLAPQK